MTDPTPQQPPPYTGPDRRSESSAWRRQVDDQLAEGKKTMEGLRADLTANTAATNAIKADTGELVESFRNLKGALKVLNWVGGIAKPIAAIAMCVGAVWGVWLAIKNGGPPPGSLK